MKNNKLICKNVFYICKLCKNIIPKERIDKIANDEIKCITNEEIMIKRLVNAINYIFCNINQKFCEEIINQSYFLLTNNLLDKDIANRIVSMYYENIDNSVYYLTSLIHLFIINNITNRTIEYAFIISEWIMVKKNKTLIIPRDFTHYDYEKAISSNNFSLLIRVIFEMEYIINNRCPCKYTRNEIIQKIKEIKNDLIIKFNIRKLYLFGSFAKGTNDKNSDIDFLVIIDDTLINTEKLKQVDFIKEFLSKLLECSVDVLDFSYALENLGENEMENLVTLI